MHTGDSNSTHSNQAVTKAILVLLLLGTVIYSFVISLHYDWLQRIPGWFFSRKESLAFPYDYGFLFFMLVFAFFVIWFVFKFSNWVSIDISLVIILFLVLQIGYGVVKGGGFESIRLKYAKAAISEELQTVCQAHEGLLSSVRNYDSLYGENFWLGTKPPGFFLFYAAIKDAVGLFRPAVLANPKACFITLTKNFAYLFPIFATIVLIPLFFIQSQLSSMSFSYASILTYISAPSVLLMTLLPDQFLFPMLFTVYLLVLTFMITKQSTLFAFLAGGMAYLLVFMSFSLLPIFGLTLFWLSADFWINRETRTLKTLFLLLSAFLGGLLLAVLVTWLFLGYNPLTRYQLAFQKHREIKQFEFSVKRIFEYGLLNHVDFMLWTGFGILFLFYVSSIRASILFLQNKASTYDGFRVAFFLTFIAINLAGQTRSEVGRLWVFLLPGMALSIFPETLNLLRKSMLSFQLFFLLQMLSTFLIFYYIRFP